MRIRFEVGNSEVSASFKCVCVCAFVYCLVCVCVRAFVYCHNVCIACECMRVRVYVWLMSPLCSKALGIPLRMCH